MSASPLLAKIMDTDGQSILADWLRLQLQSAALRPDLLTETELRDQSQQLLGALRRATQQSDGLDFRSDAWDDVRDVLARVSRARAQHGFTRSETAVFVLSLKQPLFDRLRSASQNDASILAQALWTTTVLLDDMGLFTTDVFLKSREEVIARQQRELLELSTPVVRLWQGVLALPLIGTLDSERTQVVMESLLQKITETNAPLAIIDITGVPTVDTLVAQHLLKTVAAARLMGADCIISGIRPQIAQTIVHLGVDLADVTTKATLADAFSIALRRSGLTVKPVNPQ